MIPLFGDENPNRARDVLEGRLIWTAICALRVGTSAILDFGLWGRDERSSLRWLAAENGATSQVVYLPITADEQRQRIDRRYRDSPHTTWHFTDEDLEEWRALFRGPG